MTAKLRLIQRFLRLYPDNSKEPPIRVRNEREIFFLMDIPYVAPAARSI